MIRKCNYGSISLQGKSDPNVAVVVAQHLQYPQMGRVNPNLIKYITLAMGLQYQVAWEAAR